MSSQTLLRVCLGGLLRGTFCPSLWGDWHTPWNLAESPVCGRRAPGEGEGHRQLTAVTHQHPKVSIMLGKQHFSHSKLNVASILPDRTTEHPWEVLVLLAVGKNKPRFGGQQIWLSPCLALVLHQIKGINSTH